MEKELIPLVPEKTYAVCTNGLQIGQMVVTSQDVFKMQDGRLIATMNDKPTKFACVYTGLLVALIGGALTALFCTGIGATVGFLFVSVIMGIIAAHGLSSVVCRWCLNSAQWLPSTLHAQIEIKQQMALTAKSTIVCTPPLPFISPGSIKLYYSKEVANQVGNIYRWQNYQKIFNGALTGWAIPSLIYNSCGMFCSSGILRGSLKLLAGGAKALTGGFIIDSIQTYIGNYVGDSWTPVNDEIETYADSLDDEKYSNTYNDSNDYNIDWKNTILGEDGSNAWGILRNQKMINADKSIVMRFGNKLSRLPKVSKSNAMKLSWRLTNARPKNRWRGIAVLGLGFFGNCLAEIYTSHLENAFKNALPTIINEEIQAMEDSRLFETEV